MVLGEYKVGARLAVSDMDRARIFYEGKLGLRVAFDSPGFSTSKDVVVVVSDKFSTDPMFRM